MARYYKKILIDSITSISQGWLIIGIIFIFGLANVSANKCCFSTKSALQTEPNNYLLNITASHVNSKKGNNVYVAAISFPEGYIVLGLPYSPYNKMTCTPIPTTGAIQFQCESRDRAQLFVTFDLLIQPTPPSNSTIAPTSLFIYGDKCQNLQYCTNLAEKAEAENSNKISLGPFGTWPKYAVIIAGIILAITFLVASYLVYKRNRPDETYKDRSITPGTGHYNDKVLFSPNSLLRTDDDADLPPDDKPKNTLIQFGSAVARSPERSKSIQNRNQQPSLTRSPSKKKKEKDHQGIEIYDNVNSDGGEYGGDKVLESTVIEMSGNNGCGSLERGYSKTRRNKDKDNNNVNRTSGYSTSDMSKTISISDHEWSGGGDLSDNNKNEIYSSTTAKHLSSKSESRKDRKSSNNNNGNKPHRRSTSRENREGRIVDRTTSTRRRSHSRPRKNSFSPTSASKSTGDLHRSLSTRTRQPDHYKKSSDANLNRRKSNKRRDLISNDDIESTASSSDIPLGDRVPLAMLARSATISWKPDNYNNNDNNDEEDDEDTTPLGRISAYGATSTSSNNRLHGSELNEEVLDVLETYKGSVDIEKGLSNAHKEEKSDGDSDEEIPIGQLIKK